MPRPTATAVSTAATACSEPEALLAQAAAGDYAAFVQVFDRYAPQVLGVIQRVLTDVDVSEQALEYVFLRLWKEASHLVRARVSVAAWLVLTARAHAVARLRRGRTKSSDPASQPGTAGPLAVSLSWVPDARAIECLDQRRVLLRKVLGQLPRPQLNVLELVVFGGRAETELAGDLGEPLARVKTELRAATRFLRHRRRAVVGSWTVDI